VRFIRSIQINLDSIDLAYMDDADVRLGGNVFQTHHISISRGSSNYDSEIDELEAAAEALLTDVLEDFTSSPAYAIPVPPDDDDDDDDD
jgi:hypothetical protein